MEGLLSRLRGSQPSTCTTQARCMVVVVVLLGPSSRVLEQEEFILPDASLLCPLAGQQHAPGIWRLIAEYLRV